MESKRLLNTLLIFIIFLLLTSGAYSDGPVIDLSEIGITESENQSTSDFSSGNKGALRNTAKNLYNGLFGA